MRRAFGALARLLIRLLPRTTALPILSGPLRGTRWTVHSSNLSFWTGAFERDNQQIIASILRPGDLFVDVGAHVGFFSLLGAKCVGSKGRVLAFEPLSENRTWLKRNLELNRIEHVEIFPIALSEEPGSGTFGHSGSPSEARLDPQGSVVVGIETLDRVLERTGSPAVRLVKVDVEGAEAQVLRGSRGLLALDEKPALLIATHGWRAHSECVDVLSELGSRVVTDRLDEVSGNGMIQTLGGG